MPAPALDSIYPADGFLTFPVGATIQILLDRETDLESVKDSIMLFGPDFDLRIGADSAVHAPDAGANPLDDYARSPGYGGEQAVEFTLTKVDEVGDAVDPQATYEEAEELRHLITVTPTNRLRENTEYQLFIAGASGDEDNNAALSTRSVFDAKAGDANLGSGNAKSSGVYRLDDDQIVISVVEGGSAADMRFDWWLASAPTTIYTVTSFHGKIELAAGVFVEFFGDSDTSFEVSDTFTIDLRAAEFLATTIKVTFSTAVDTVIAPPDTVSTSPIGIVPSESEAIPGTIEDDFAMLTSNPTTKSSNLRLETNQIVLTFNKTLDSTSVNLGTVSLKREAVTGTGYPEDVPFSMIVSGDKIYINIVPEEV
jgi:hypothetical protein